MHENVVRKMSALLSQSQRITDGRRNDRFVTDAFFQQFLLFLLFCEFYVGLLSERQYIIICGPFY